MPRRRSIAGGPPLLIDERPDNLMQCEVPLSDIFTAMPVEVAPSNAFIESVRAFGIVQPIAVVHSVDGDDDPTGQTRDVFEIIDGQRRVAAARAVGLEAIPALIYPAGTSRERLNAMTVIANQQRSNNPVGEAMAIINMMGTHSEEQIARALRLSSTTVRRRAALRFLPQVALTHLSCGLMAMHIAESIIAARHNTQLMELVETWCRMYPTRHLTQHVLDNLLIPRSPEDVSNLRPSGHVRAVGEDLNTILVPADPATPTPPPLPVTETENAEAASDATAEGTVVELTRQLNDERARFASVVADLNHERRNNDSLNARIQLMEGRQRRLMERIDAAQAAMPAGVESFRWEEYEGDTAITVNGTRYITLQQHEVQREQHEVQRADLNATEVSLRNEIAILSAALDAAGARIASMPETRAAEEVAVDETWVAVRYLLGLATRALPVSADNDTDHFFAHISALNAIADRRVATEVARTYRHSAAQVTPTMAAGA